MTTVTISRPDITRPSFSNSTARSDYIRGSGPSELLGYTLSGFEQSYINFLIFNGFDQNAARDIFFTGSGPSFGGGPQPEDDSFAGDERIFGRGGNDYIVDLFGNNFIVTEEGNDRILLGNGNDRIFDQGGNNEIEIFGGNNTVTTRDGNDIINTGDGGDNINAFDGRNIINAGEGNNIVRGGNDFDDIRVGTGDDFVDVRGGFNGDQDLNGDGIAETGFDKNFDGVIDPPDQQLFLDPLGQFFFANNFVLDTGGSDNIRSTAPGSRQGDDLVFSDIILSVTPGSTADGVPVPFTDLNFTDVTPFSQVGDDTIDLGAGDNRIIDGGGNNIVRTLQGNDTIFTSFFFAGDDDIDSGAGSDTINPGAGSDIVRAGPGDDVIFLENDGDLDTLVYRAGVNGAVGDEVPASVAGAALTDVVTGFDIAGGIDKIDMRAFAVDISDLLLLNAAAFGVEVGGADFDLLIGWDTNDTGALDTGDIFTTILADVNALPDASNFLFDTLVV